MMSFEQMLAAVAGQGGEATAKPEFPLKEAQRAELAIIRDQMADRGRMGPFRQWEEVAVVHRTGSFTVDTVLGAVFVFWKYISVEDAFRRFALLGSYGSTLSYFSANPDCLIAWVAKEGLRFEVADAALLVRVNREGSEPDNLNSIPAEAG